MIWNISERLCMVLIIDNLDFAGPILMLMMDWSALLLRDSRIIIMFCLYSIKYVQFDVMQLNYIKLCPCLLDLAIENWSFWQNILKEKSKCIKQLERPQLQKRNSKMDAMSPTVHRALKSGCPQPPTLPNLFIGR